MKSTLLVLLRSVLEVCAAALLVYLGIKYSHDLPVLQAFFGAGAAIFMWRGVKL